MTHKRKSKYHPTKTIYIDADNTLIVNGVLNDTLVDWIKGRRRDCFEIVLWSARGRLYAESVAERFMVADLFDFVVSKPGYIVDDMGTSWNKYIKVISDKQITQT